MAQDKSELSFMNQLELGFMDKRLRSVTALGYIGGQDEDLGGYCEPLVVKHLDGMEEYLLHQMYQSRTGGIYDEDSKIINNHRKLLFPNKSYLMDAWEYVYEYLTSRNEKWSWKETDSVCGFDITPSEFYDKKRMICEGVLSLAQ